MSEGTPKQDTLKLYIKEIKRRYREGESVNALAQFYGVSRATLTIFLQRCGVKLRSLATAAKERGRRQRGDKNPRWQGARIINPKGYALLWMPKHPRADRNGRVFEHIVVAEKMLGRPIRVGEPVHHENDKKDDNRPENLSVMSHKKHLGLHLKITGLEDVPGLYRSGLSIREIAERKGINRFPVKRVLLEHGVHLRSRSEAAYNAYSTGRLQKAKRKRSKGR